MAVFYTYSVSTMSKTVNWKGDKVMWRDASAVYVFAIDKSSRSLGDLLVHVI